MKPANEHYPPVSDVEAGGFQRGQPVYSASEMVKVCAAEQATSYCQAVCQLVLSMAHVG